jgi:hypothetical protein
MGEKAMRDGRRVDRFLMVLLVLSLGVNVVIVGLVLERQSPQSPQSPPEVNQGDVLSSTEMSD